MKKKEKKFFSFDFFDEFKEETYELTENIPKDELENF